MDHERIRAQHQLLKQFAARNPGTVGEVSHTPDFSEIRVNLRDVPLVVHGPNGLAVRRDHVLTFAFDDGYPSHPPVFNVGPLRPVSSHIWPNRRICLLQEAWYPGYELPNGLVDFVGMLQGGEVLHPNRAADSEDACWLGDARNRRRLIEMVGRPTRFVTLALQPSAPILRTTPTTCRAAVMRASAPNGGLQ